MTKDEMLVFVENKFPDLPLNKVQTNSIGWDNDILIVNEEIVFRFPKSDELLSKIEDEGKILEILKTQKPLLFLPSYEYLYRNNALKGVKYDFMKGSSLSEFPVSKLRDNPFNAKGIGDFLTKLHSIELSKLHHSNVGTTHSLKYWENLYAMVERDVFPFLASGQQHKISELFSEFLERLPALTNKKTIIHGDLTAANIIYNHEKECINGIIDFTDAQLGDPAFDFAGLYWDFGLEFTKDVLRWYRSTENKEALLNRVKTFYGLQPVFHELLYAVNHNHQINWDTALKKFNRLYQLAK
ncbi:aminoglycoside phosphotransferase family protein [Planococcus halotolerans]|uniref:Aminoglycoside phosphotransferase domain-containing protein n=1 Tax=Planococcus halotolerans TaxID=2233542 RepID=A0A365L0G0_9BACL|nr:aminoglycoside phosphotransferase family protein [Planococcus halotolerans]QHJ71319.1 phosphotransferase [Planococcus halotolerans]RAZ78920.1 hypothetical protein DP120_04705 [Planococcus halotolerans]